jgi:hypothetical protein
MTEIILTNFWDAKRYFTQNYPTFSIARWQPNGFNLPTIRALAPIYPFNGQPIRHLPPDEYRIDYTNYVLNSQSGKDTMEQIVNSLEPDTPLVMCCWCSPQRQEEYPKLMCHRILVGYYIEKHYPGIKVRYEGGAENPVWSKK